MKTTSSRLIATTLCALAAAALIPSTSHALGINCRGSALCNLVLADTAVEQLTAVIQQEIDGNRRYANGEQIACTILQAVPAESVSVCVFLQNTGGAQGSQIRDLIHFIGEHKCKTCGSVPTGFPDDNDVSHGQLTINAVANPCDFKQTGQFPDPIGLCR